MKNIKLSLLFILAVLVNSCTKDVDFNQIDDANIHASYIVTLVHFDLEANKFLDEFNQEMNWTSDVIEAKISTESQKYLEKVEFTVFTENSFDREFLINVIFFDENQSPIYQLHPTINIQPNTSIIKTIIEIPQSEIDFIYKAKYFGFNIVMPPRTDGGVLSGDETYKLNLKSSVELFFNYRKI